MSYQTQADEKRDLAVDSVREAIDALHSIIVKHCEGHDSFTKEYRGKLGKAYVNLLDVLGLLE